MWRRILLPALAGVLVAALTWLFGVAAVDAILIGVLLMVITGMPRWLGFPTDREWPGHPDEGGQRGYHEVRRLGDVFGRQSGGDAYTRLIVPRLRELCERRLAAAGVKPGDHAAREILGADMFEWLNGRASRLDSLSRVNQAELVLDRIDEAFDTSLDEYRSGKV